MTDVLVLGVTGMLGDAVGRELSASGLAWSATARGIAPSETAAATCTRFDVTADDIAATLASAGYPRFIINAIGITKPHIDESDIASRQRAMQINSTFPHLLAVAVGEYGAHVVQIATDCVYSGVAGNYDESALHDATDVYGKTKSLGEVPSPNMTHLRCSIIGPEVGRATFLWEWIANQPQGAEVNGFTDHLWNGITTQQFGRICAGLIQSGETPGGTHHVIPGDIVTKAQLLRDIADACGREDITVNECEAPSAIDRTLSTIDPAFSDHLWALAGHSTPPTIRTMVLEAGSAERDYRV